MAVNQQKKLGTIREDASRALARHRGERPFALSAHFAAGASSSREGRWDHLNCFKYLRVKSSLLNPWAFKFHRETCCIRLNEAGPTESQYSPKSKHGLRIQGQSERMPCPSPPPTSRLPSKTGMATRLPRQVECVSWQTLELIFNEKLID